MAPCTKVIGFVACIVTRNVLGTGSEDRSWGDAKTIKFGKIYAIISDLSDKQSIVYTYSYIESAIIEQYHYDKQLNDNCSSHTWYADGDDFDKQLEKWGVEK